MGPRSPLWGLVGVAGLVAGCQVPAAPSWTDQLEAGGVCHEVDLGDGLDTTSTEELHGLFDCLNQDGAFDPLAGVVDALDATTRSGEPAGVVVARLLTGVPGTFEGVDLAASASRALELYRTHRDLLDRTLRVCVEVLYGEPYDRVASGAVDLNAASALDRGLVRPLLPVLGTFAASELSSDREGLRLLAEVTASLTFRSLVHGLLALTRSPDPAVAQGFAALPAHLGEALHAARSPGNDRWAEASGDSLRDLVRAVVLDRPLEGRTLLAAAAEPARALLADDVSRGRVQSALSKLAADPTEPLLHLPRELLYLASVDTAGGPLEAGEDSALLVLVRLLHDGHADTVCSMEPWLGWLPFGLGDTEVSLGDLSVEILELFATLDPDQIEGGVALVSDILGWELAGWILDEMAAEGACTDAVTGRVVLTPQLVADLAVVDRLDDPEAGGVLLLLVELMAAFYDPTSSDVPALVDLVALVHAAGAVPPLEEALRDLAPSPLLDDLVVLLPAALDPERWLGANAMPPGVPAVTFETWWNIAEAAVSADERGFTPLDEVDALLRATLDPDATWLALGNAARLVQEPEAELEVAMELLQGLVELDPELDEVADLVAFLAEDGTGAATLEVLEVAELREALGRADLADEGPLPFAARLVVGGTVEEVLGIVDTLLHKVE